MGTPLDPIFIEPGDDCTTCFGTEKAHPNPTPAKIYMGLHDWSEGEAWQEAYREQLESVQTLDQQPGFPCIWAAITANFVWAVEYLPAQTAIYVLLNPPTGQSTFFGQDAAICLKTIDNNVVQFFNNVIFGGYASLVFGTPV